MAVVAGMDVEDADRMSGLARGHRLGAGHGRNGPEGVRHLAGQPVPPEIMVPAELIDRSNCHRWKVPFAQRPIPNWADFVR